MYKLEYITNFYDQFCTQKQEITLYAGNLFEEVKSYTFSLTDCTGKLQWKIKKKYSYTMIFFYLS